MIITTRGIALTVQSRLVSSDDALLVLGRGDAVNCVELDTRRLKNLASMLLRVLARPRACRVGLDVGY